MRRLLVLPACIAVLALAPAAHGEPSWAQPQIKVVVASGLMAPSAQQFRPNAALTRAELAEIVAAITRREQVVREPQRPVTLAELDRAVVRALGLGPAAREVRRKLVRAGLKPPGRAGTEIVARLLRLRYNHPAEQDGLELLPGDAVTRAETAFTVARILELSQEELVWTNDLAMSLALPRFTPWQKRVLARAVRFVGFPYVWGGSSEGPQAPFGVPSRGGFDCSGFVWRVYKLERFAEAPSLGSTLLGRTTYDMSAEMPRTQRIATAELAPGDVVFFGDRGPRSRPKEIGHMGIYVGGGWFVHSSSQGTTIAPLAGWYATSFAWGRRVLAEAKLA